MDALLQRPRPRWLPALTGIRGISILLVLAFHLELPVVNGGPVGVTAFFALSGYLITSLLIAEWSRTGRVDLRAFYVRRARRLMPALVVAVGVVFVIAAAAGHAAAITSDSLLALTYVANWARAGGDLMGMWNHTWSLAIEEQFYLLWPVGFIALHRLGALTSGRVIGLLVGLAAGSAGLRFLLEIGGASGERIYFGSDTRAEALLAGCALAAMVARQPSWHISRWTGPLALLGIVVLATATEGTGPWPDGLYTLVTIASCGLILAALRPNGSGAGLSWGPLVWLGERSYSLYLWHVPVILFLSGPLAAAPPPLRIGAMAIISIGLAEASYELVEQPFRRRGSLIRARASAPPARLAVDHSG